MVSGDFQPLKKNIDCVSVFINFNNNFFFYFKRKLRQARCADNGPHSEMSYTSFRNLLNEPRFPNGDVVDFTKINMEVLKWIREHLIVELMNRALKSAAKNGNWRSFSFWICIIFCKYYILILEKFPKDIRQYVFIPKYVPTCIIYYSWN